MIDNNSNNRLHGTRPVRQLNVLLGITGSVASVKLIPLIEELCKVVQNINKRVNNKSLTDDNNDNENNSSALPQKTQEPIIKLKIKVNQAMTLQMF